MSKKYTLITPMTMGAHPGVSAEDSESGDEVPPQHPKTFQLIGEQERAIRMARIFCLYYVFT